MTIKAKYRGKCGKCGGSISPGDSIEWSQGKTATHVRCAGTGAPNPAPTPPSGPRPRRGGPRKPSAPRTKYRDPLASETVIQRRASGGAYTVGETVHASKVPGGGGPDGRYWTITFARHQRVDEDNGFYDSTELGYARPATDEEVAPVLASIAAASNRPACERWLEAALSAGAPGVTWVSDTGKLPPTADREVITGSLLELVIGRRVSTSGAVTDGGTTYVLTTDAIVAHHGGYYDDYRSITRTLPRSAETDQIVDLLRALAANDIARITVLADRARELGHGAR